MISNTSALLVGRYTIAALGWLGSLLIVRSLSLEEWGRFSFVFSFLGLISVFTELGMGRVAIKGLLDEGDPGTFAGAYITLRGALGVLAYAMAVAFTALAGYPAEVVHATAIAGLVLILATVSHAYEAVFQAHLQMRTVAIGMVVAQLAQLTLVAAIIAAGGSVVLLTIPVLVFELVTLGWRLRGVRRIQPVLLNIDLAMWRKLAREAAPIAAGAILASAYYRIDSVMLSKLDTFSAVGIYGVAYKFADLAHYLPTALMITVLPLLARAWPHDPEAFGETFQRAVTILALVGAIVTAQFAVFAHPLISLLYGNRYAIGADTGRLVVFAEFFTAFGSLAVTALVAIGRHRLYPLVALAGLAGNVALNLWLIPTRSYQGAAMATLVTEAAVTLILLATLSDVAAIRPIPWRPILLALASGGVAGLIGWLTWQFLPWPAGVLAAGFAYLLLVNSARMNKGRSLLQEVLGPPAATAPAKDHHHGSR